MHGYLSALLSYLFLNLEPDLVWLTIDTHVQYDSVNDFFVWW